MGGGHAQRRAWRKGGADDALPARPHPSREEREAGQSFPQSTTDAHLLPCHLNCDDFSSAHQRRHFPACDLRPCDLTLICPGPWTPASSILFPSLAYLLCFTSEGSVPAVGPQHSAAATVKSRGRQ